MSRVSSLWQKCMTSMILKTLKFQMFGTYIWFTVIYSMYFVHVWMFELWQRNTHSQCENSCHSHFSPIWQAVHTSQSPSFVGRGSWKASAAWTGVMEGTGWWLTKHEVSGLSKFSEQGRHWALVSAGLERCKILFIKISMSVCQAYFVMVMQS